MTLSRVFLSSEDGVGVGYAGADVRSGLCDDEGGQSGRLVRAWNSLPVESMSASNKTRHGWRKYREKIPSLYWCAEKVVSEAACLEDGRPLFTILSDLDLVQLKGYRIPNC